MLTIIKEFIILFLLCLWEQGAPWQFSKEINKLSFQLSFQIYSVLAQTKGERKIFFGRVQEGGPHCKIITWFDIRAEKVSPFMKFEIILPLLCFLLDLLTNKHCRAWSSMINLWIDFRTCQK